jgi:hypothetical protein
MSPEEINYNLLLNCTCGEYTSILDYNDKYVLIKKRGHTSYLNRVSGCAWCGCRYYIINHQLPPTQYNLRMGFELANSCSGYMFYHEGRLSKADKIKIKKFGLSI